MIALDAMGGDFAPRAPVEAVSRALRDPTRQVTLVGDLAQVEKEVRRFHLAHSGVRLVHTPECVTPTDPATVLLREKPRASLRLAFELVRDGQAQAVVSAGNSGALMIAGKHVLGTLPGVERPAIATHLPLKRGVSLLLDSGANVDCKPGYLLQFARMGRVYAQTVLGRDTPRIALLSNGGEEGKGNELVRQAYTLFQQEVEGFIGNLEPRDLFRGKADVIVCDGFVGNLVLKTAEAAGAHLRMFIRDTGFRHPLAWLGLRLIRDPMAELSRRTDPREVGGSLLLGVNGVAVVAHGGSNAHALNNALGQAQRCVETGLVEALKHTFENHPDSSPGRQVSG